MKKNVGLQSSHDLVCVNRLDQLENAYKLMTRAAVRHLPVLDENGVIIGMLSDRDIIRAMKKPVNNHWSALPPVPEFDSKDSVQEFMSWPIGTIDESSSIVQAAESMYERKISALVVTRDHQSVGIITTDDILKSFIDDHQKSLTDVKNYIFGAIYRSPVGSIAQALSNSGI